jgi:hypothetical protein
MSEYKMSLRQWMRVLSKTRADDRRAGRPERLEFEQTGWGGDAWRQVAETASPEAMEDAVSETTMRAIFKVFGPLSDRRTAPKSLARAEKKLEQAPTGPTNYFRVFNDWAASRLFCRVDEIQVNIDRLRNLALLAKEPGAVFYVRGESYQLPYGNYVTETGAVKDGVQYAYYYSETIGHIVEIQIGEPLLLFAFKLNSLKRQDEQLVSPFDKPTKLYDKFLRLTLSQEGANTGAPQLSARELEALYEETQSDAERLYKDRYPEYYRKIMIWLGALN